MPATNTYHADIDALADAGVTTGCGDGSTYGPSAFVTREQMAAFISRLGALAAGKTPVVNAATAVTADTAGDSGTLDGMDSSDFLLNETVIGQYSCDGLALVPTTGAYDYSATGGRNSVSNPDIGHACQLILPDGALITALRAYVYDTSPTEDVGGCFIYRFNLAARSQSVTGTTGTSGDAFVGGSAVIEDLTIDLTVDNTANAYALYCNIGGTGTHVTLSGVQVDYEVAGLPVP